MRPTHRNPRKRLRNQKSVPGIRHPRTLRQQIQNPHRHLQHLRQLHRSHFGFIARSAGAIGGEDSNKSGIDGVSQSQQSSGALARTRTPDRIEAELLDRPGYQLAIETLTHQDRTTQLAAKIKQRRQRTPMPEAIDPRSRNGRRNHARLNHIFKPKRRTNRPQQQSNQPRDNGKRNPLPKRKTSALQAGGHEAILTSPAKRQCMSEVKLSCALCPKPCALLFSYTASSESSLAKSPACHTSEFPPGRCATQSIAPHRSRAASALSTQQSATTAETAKPCAETS
jgi:hypothetical protein